MCPFELVATPAASPETIPLGNLKKFATTRYGSSGTGWNGVVFADGDSVGIDCAPTRDARNIRQARTSLIDLFILFKRRSRQKTNQGQAMSASNRLAPGRRFILLLCRDRGFLGRRIAIVSRRSWSSDTVCEASLFVAAAETPFLTTAPKADFHLGSLRWPGLIWRG